MRSSGDGGGAAAGHAVPRLSGLARGAGSRRPRWRPGGRRWPGWKSPPIWRRRIARVRRSRPSRSTLCLSETLTAALTSRRAAQGVTLNTVLQAAWAILLGRLTGRDDVVFGVTVAGRPPELAGIESMVGLFINTLPLRVKLPPAQAAAASCSGAAGQPVAADRAPASRAGRDPGAGRTGRAVRHAGGVRELSGRPRQPGGETRRAVCGLPASAGTMRRTIR